MDERRGKDRRYEDKQGGRATDGNTVQLERDPYEVLGIDRNADSQAIRTSYRKLALQYHPDKAGPGRAHEFHEIKMAYAILSDEEKRKAYDREGFEGLEAEDLVFEVDLSSLGAVNTAMAAMFSKLGAPIRTTLPPELLEEINSGAFRPYELRLEETFHGKIEKQKCAYFSVRVTEEEADAGLLVLAFSSSRSRFKLLQCECVGPHDYEVADRVDSENLRGITAATMFFLDRTTFFLNSSPAVMEQARYKNPEDVLFRRLDSLKPREARKLKQGVHVFAVYGDNWFQKTSFSINVRSLLDSKVKSTIENISALETDLVAMKSSLSAFEDSYMKAQKKYLDACERYDLESTRLKELTAKREDAYIALGDTGASSESSKSSAPPEATARSKKGEVSMKAPGLAFKKLFRGGNR